MQHSSANGVLELAERMAKRHIPMTMEDWTKRIDIILEASGDCLNCLLMKSSSMKRLILSLFAVVCLHLNASITGSVGNSINWEFNESTGTLVIEGEGDSDQYIVRTG